LVSPIWLYFILIPVHWLTGAAILTEKIKDTRDTLAALNVGKTIPVGNSDAGFYFNTRVLEASDFGVKISLIERFEFFLPCDQLSNVHAWFANTSIADAAPWVFQYFEETNVVPASLLANKVRFRL
jgi:hypothetical protein